MRAFVLVVTLLAGGEGPTWDTARTQLEMSKVAGGERDESRRRMEAELASVLELAKADPTQVQRVRAAQEAWEAYRGAQVAAWYGCEGRHFYGSALSMCQLVLEVRLYEQRRDELSAMAAAAGPEAEGDICSWVASCVD